MPEPQQFRYDFTDEQVGQPPDVNWESYPTNAVLVVTPEHTLKLEVATQFNFSASMFPRAIQDRLDTVAVVAKFRHHGGDEGGNFGFYVDIADRDEFVYHGAAVDIFKDGSILSPTYPDGALVLTVYSDSAGGWLESPPLPQPEPDSYYWFHAVMTPDEMKIRLWKDGDPLPLTWDLEADFGVGHPGNFRIVATGFGAPGTYLEIDYIGIGIGGAPAPMPVPVSVAAQTRRVLTAAASVQGQTRRRLTELVAATGQTRRALAALTAALAQTRRRLAAPTEALAQTRRRLHVLVAVAGQTRRRVVTLVSAQGQTRRILSALLAVLGQTRRSLFATVSRLWQTRRRVFDPRFKPVPPAAATDWQAADRPDTTWTPVGGEPTDWNEVK